MKRATFFVFYLILTGSSAVAQDTLRLDTQHKNTLIDTILTCFETNYVFPEVALSLKDSINQRNESGDYSELADLQEFLASLSSDMRRITSDKHIGIHYIEKSDTDTRQSRHSLLAEQITTKQRSDFSFRKAEWFPGNVGYIRFDRFEDPRYAGEAAAATIDFVANCDAIIVDLRYNYGGEEKMVRYLASYFFAEPTLLNTRYFSKQDSSVQSWTDSRISGNNLIDKDVYILTSSNTASGAEAFAYILKNYHRATIIGETTRGAAHWAEYFYYPSLKIEIKMPVARPINPVTKTNWEGVGVKPDMEIPECKALDKAYLLALEKMIRTSPDESKKKELEWYRMITLERCKDEMISSSDLDEYAGEYEELKFLVIDNRLYWHQGEGEDFALEPISRDHFLFDDSDDYVVRFVRNKEGLVSGYQLLVKGSAESAGHDKTERTEK